MLRAPDVGLLIYTYGRDRRNIFEATKSLQIVGDADIGYDNVVSVGLTVSGYASAGFAGILIEDQVDHFIDVLLNSRPSQVWPKSCGHMKGKRLVPIQEVTKKIAAAVAVRDSGGDIVFVVRTDAKQAESFDEALFRVRNLLKR